LRTSNIRDKLSGRGYYNRNGQSSYHSVPLNKEPNASAKNKIGSNGRTEKE
jgi:hypothetical protein